MEMQNIFIYHRYKTSNVTIINIYVNNFLLVSKLYISIDWIKKNLKNKYNIKDLGEVKIIIN